MIKAVAIDDEPIAIKVIQHYCKDLDFVELVRTFMDAKDGLRYLQKFPADVLLLDIDMPFLNGIDLYKQIKQDTLVIFITSRDNYAVEGFNLNAVDYLVKPFTPERFQRALRKASDLLSLQKQAHQTPDEKHLFVRSDFSLVKIATNDIIYIEGLDDYLRIHLVDQKPLVTRMTLKTMQDKLPEKSFVRIHRSFIIAANKLERIKGRFVVVGGKELPVGLSYEESAMKKLGR